MAANLYGSPPNAAMATDAGYRELSLSTSYFCVTLLLTACSVTHGRRRAGSAGTVAAAGNAGLHPGCRGGQPSTARRLAPRRGRRTPAPKPAMGRDEANGLDKVIRAVQSAAIDPEGDLDGSGDVFCHCLSRAGRLCWITGRVVLT
jgi:hypothetical protein